MLNPRLFLALAASPAPIASLPALAADQPRPAAGTAKGADAKKGAPQVIAIEVTRDGFVPARASVKAGRPVKLVVTRKVERTCAKEIVVKQYGVNQPLPLDRPIEVTFTPEKPGPVRYACGMDMIAGVLTVE